MSGRFKQQAQSKALEAEKAKAAAAKRSAASQAEECTTPE
jgi:hypothetical protein